MTQIIKLVATAAFAAVLVVSLGSTAQAATLSASQIQAVVSLLQAFGADATSITNVQQALSGVQTSGDTSTASSVSSSLIGYLRMGDEGDAVQLLQILLAADPSVYPEGLVSGYFGPLTQKALRQYQKKHGLEQVGFIGPRTLQALNDELEDNPLSLEDDDEDEDGDDSQNRGRGHRFCAIVPPGHLIAPGWLKKNNGVAPIVPTCQKLPGGIAKKLGLGGTGTTTDTVAPTISELSVDSIDTDSAEVEWKTNEKATSVVNFGTTTSYGMTASKGSTRDTSHSVMLTGLSAGMLYHYRVTSVDAAGNAATSSDQTFTTDTDDADDTTDPVISDIEATSIDSDSAQIRWDTDEDATSKVYYSTATPVVLGSASTVSSNTLEDSHEIELTGLTASTTYYYVVESEDAADNTTTADEKSFVTSAP